MNTKINLPKNVQILIDVLKQNGYEAYVVGGCVRDALLGKEPSDWDLCTNATPEEMCRILKNKKFVVPNFTSLVNVPENTFSIGHPILTGAEYGTVVFPVNGEFFEITTFHKETGYSDGRHPDSVEYAKTIEEDLSRRDFTINAMAYNEEKGLVDPFGGKEDLLQKKVLRCVGNASDRIDEDGLRILRALRFVLKYNLSIDSSLRTAIHTKANKLDCLSAERIQSEFCKILQVIPYTRATSEFKEGYFAHALCQIVPELSKCVYFDQKNPYHHLDVFMHILATLTCAKNVKNGVWQPCDDLVTNLALFFHDIGKPECAVADSVDSTRLHFYGHSEISAKIAEDVMKRLHFDNATKNAVVELVYHHDVPFTVSEKFVRRMLNKLGKDQFERLLTVRTADIMGQRMEYRAERLHKVNDLRTLYAEMMEKEQYFSLKDLAVNGKDLIEIGYTPGKELGNALNELLDLVINGELENDEQLLLERADLWLAKEDDREM